MKPVHIVGSATATLVNRYVSKEARTLLKQWPKKPQEQALVQVGVTTPTVKNLTFRAEHDHFASIQ